MATNNAQFYRQGYGDATVLNTSGIDNAFAQALAKQQAQRQQELKVLTDQQAQLKPDGLRNDADRKDFFDKVNNWRTQAVQASNEKDPYKRSLLKSQADQSYLQAQDLVGKSKQAAQNEHGFSTQLLNPAIRDRYTPDVVDKYLANKNLSVNDPNYVKDFNAYEQVADHTKTLDEIDKINKNLLANAQWGTPTLLNKKVGNRNATFINNSRTVNPQVQVDAYSRKYDVDQNFRKTLQDLHPEIYSNPDLSPAQQKEVALGALVKNYGPISEYKAPQEKVDHAPDKFYEHYNYQLAHPKSGEEGTASTHRQKVIGGLMNGDTKYLTEAQNYLGADAKINFMTSEKSDKSKGGYNFIRVKIPDKIDDNGHLTPGLTEDISLSKGDPTNRLNAILNQYTGEKISPSKLNTEGGKPRGSDIIIPSQQRPEKQSMVQKIKQALTPKSNAKQSTTFKVKGKEYKADAIQKAAVASGMTVDEYLQEVNK